jgi:hypothetical protein
MDIIFRNLQRLVFSDEFFGLEHIEPMSEWKWNKLYELSIAYGIGPWVVDGIRRYSDDFFLQPSDTLRQQFLGLDGPRCQELLDKFKLLLMRSQSLRNHFTQESLQAYFNDFMNSIRNIDSYPHSR